MYLFHCSCFIHPYRFSLPFTFFSLLCSLSFVLIMITFICLLSMHSFNSCMHYNRVERASAFSGKRNAIWSMSFQADYVSCNNLIKMKSKRAVALPIFQSTLCKCNGSYTKTFVSISLDSNRCTAFVATTNWMARFIRNLPTMYRIAFKHFFHKIKCQFFNNKYSLLIPRKHKIVLCLPNTAPNWPKEKKKWTQSHWLEVMEFYWIEHDNNNNQWKPLLNFQYEKT